MSPRDNGATKFETVRYEPKGPICHIVLNRPEKLNAANDQLVEEVNDALFEFDADPTLQVAILSGAARAFCSGADVRQRQLRTREELKRLGGPAGRRSRENGLGDARSEEHTSELQSHRDLPSFPTRRSSDLGADVRQRQLRTREELKRLGGPAGRRSRENGLGDA